VPSIELAVTCFRGNEDELLRPGVLAQLRSWVAPHEAMLTVLVNNVADPQATIEGLRPAVDAGVVDRVVVVADHLDRALRRTGTTRATFGRYLHWSDGPLVALTLEGPELLLYWDAGAALLDGSSDWVGACAALLRDDEQVLVANPRWADEATVLAEADRRDGPFALGYGFSDQVFLIRRSRTPYRLRGLLPYWVRSPASVRYPFTGAHSFEQLLDVHMRTAGLLRATHIGAEYRHVDSGHRYLPQGLAERIAFRRDRAIRRALARGSWASPRLRESGLLARREPV
jgi:hypothetical protein